MRNSNISIQLTMCRLVIYMLVIFCLVEFVDAGPPQGQNWKMIWSDEFEGSQIDDSKWTWFLGWSGPRYREAYYTNEDAYLEDGNLVFRVRKYGDLFKTSWLTTKNKFKHKYGYWEIRCKFSEMEAKGYWVAFWLWAYGGSYDGKVETGAEIDIMEYAWMNNKTNHALAWGKQKGQRMHHTQETPGLREGFHTFGFQWTKEEYIFYINGKEIWRSDKGVSQAEQTLFLSVEIQKEIWGDGGNIKHHVNVLPDYWIIDYVRIYDLEKDAVKQ